MRSGAVTRISFTPTGIGLVLLANASKYFWQRGDAWADLSARLADVIRAALLPLI